MENKKIYILIALTVLLIISLLFVNKIFKSNTQTPYKLNEDKIESQENNLQNNFEQKDLFEPTKQEEKKVLENNEQKNVKIEKKSNNIKKTVNHNSQTIEQKKDNKIFDKSEEKNLEKSEEKNAKDMTLENTSTSNNVIEIPTRHYAKENYQVMYRGVKYDIKIRQTDVEQNANEQ
ncbi:MAG: hypothetical protein Q4E83_07170 [bacterium]|nr:hypothetical protein [bacterium]